MPELRVVSLSLSSLCLLSVLSLSTHLSMIPGLSQCSRAIREKTRRNERVSRERRERAKGTKTIERSKKNSDDY